LEQDDKARARARRDYLFAGATALAAAIVGIADRGMLSEIPIPVAVAAIILAAVVYVRVAYGLLRGRDDDSAAPATERMRRMAFIWLILTAVIGVAVVKDPAASVWEGGAAGLELRDWAAGAAGIAVVVAAIVRAVRMISLGRR
jgi:hypothetical protein